MVNEALSQELQNGIHALSIVVSLKKKIMIHVQTVCDLQKFSPFSLFICEYIAFNQSLVLSHIVQRTLCIVLK